MLERIEIKTALGLDDAGVITGIAWPFGTADRVGDMIEKGAFRMSGPLPMLFEHDPAQTVGVWNSAAETDKGLEVRGEVFGNMKRAQEVRAIVRKGLIGGLSIGFRTNDSFVRKGGGRTITSLDLAEISLVRNPMNTGARVLSAKSATTAILLAEAINRAASALKAA